MYAVTDILRAFVLIGRVFRLNCFSWGYIIITRHHGGKRNEKAKKYLYRTYESWTRYDQLPRGLVPRRKEGERSRDIARAEAKCQAREACARTSRNMEN